MGQQGSSKPGGAPNPNYGSGAGTDNSNGVYNASAALQAAQPARTYEQGLGAGTIGATGTTDPLASPTLPPPAGVTGTTDPATAVGATGATTTTAANPNGAAFTNSAFRPAKGQSKGMTPQAPAGMQGAATGLDQALAGGPTGQPPAYSTAYTPPPPTPLTAPGASSPMSGSSLTIGDAVQQGKSAKGGSPAAPAGVGGQTGGQTGVAGATGTTAPGATGTTGPIDYAAQSGRFNAQNDPTGAWAKYYNMQQQGKAAVTNAPDWMKGLMSGVGADKSTNESRAAAEQAGNPIQTNKTYTNWESAVKAMTGQADPWKALQQAYATAGSGASAQMNQANIHRALLNSGINKETADRVHEMFASGTDHEGAARRLGITDKYLTFTGATQAQKDQAKELADWHKANPTATAPPGATGAPEGPPAATGATGPAAPPPIVQPAAGPPAPPNAPMPGGAPEPSQQTITQLAQQYMVSPEIARQIYRALLETSMSSGGGSGPGGAGGDASGGGEGE